MCVMGTDHDPTNTRLYHIPVYIGNLSYNLCLYVNNLDTKGTPALMVVPIPKDAEHQLGMVDITTPAMKGFRSDVSEIFNRRNNFLNFCVKGFDSPLQVHRIGNYNISIASDKNQLLNRVNWQIFNKPKDFERRISVFDDSKLYPFDCCYVVAQATENIKDDGFGIVYKNKGTDYIPTAHELTEKDFHHYDVECYHLSTKNESAINLSVFRNWNQMNGIDEWGGYADGALKKTLHEMMVKNGVKVVNMTGENTNNGIKLEKCTGYEISNICDGIQFHSVKMEDGTISKMAIPKIECISYFKVNGYFCNANVLISNENKDGDFINFINEVTETNTTSKEVCDLEKEIDEASAEICDNKETEDLEKGIDEENYSRPSHCAIS